MNKAKTLMIGIVTKNDIHCLLAGWLFRLIQNPPKKLAKVSYIITQSSTSAVAGVQRLFHHAYDNGFDYYLAIDSDIVPPDGVIDKLLEVDQDIVVAPIWHYDRTKEDIHLNIHYNNNFSERIYRPKAKGCEQIYASSLAITLFRRSMYEKFIKAGLTFSLVGEDLPEQIKGNEGDNILFYRADKLGLKTYVCWEAGGGTHVGQANLNNTVVSNLIKRHGKGSDIV